MSGVYRINGYNSVRRINTKRVSAGAVGWWLAGGISAANCIAAYQPKGAASYAASKVNLTGNATYDATEGVAPDWDTVNGWKFDGSDDYLDTNVSVVTGDSYSVIIKYSNAGSTNARRIFGSYTESFSGRWYIAPMWYGLGSRFYNANSYVNASSDYTAAVLAMAGWDCYENGTSFGTISPLETGNTNTLFVGGAKRDNGALYLPCDADVQALAIYSTKITADQVSALTTAMNAL